MTGYGRRLENLREKYGYTKKEVSSKLGFSPNVYGNYEREERNPSIETLKELSAFYDVSVDYIVTGKEYKPETINNKPKIEAIEELLTIFAEKGIDDPYFIQVEKWAILTKEDIRDISEHFEWKYDRAKSRK